MKTIIKLAVLVFTVIFAMCDDTSNESSDSAKYKFYLALINNTDTVPLATFSFKSDHTLDISSKKTIVSTLDYPGFGAAHPSGNYLYVANHGLWVSDRNCIGDGSTLSMFLVKTDGSLSPLGTPNTVATGTGPFAVEVHPSGDYVYVTNDAGNSISMYQVNSNGSLSSIGVTGTVPAGTYPKGLAIDPSGQYLYAVNYTGLSISMYSINNGLLTELPSSPLSTGAGNSPWDIIVHPDGNYAYVTIYNGSGNGQIFIYSINNDGALLSSGSLIIPDYGNPYNFAVHPSGKYMYVANYGTVDAYTVNLTNGNLSFFNRVDDVGEIGGCSSAIVIDPNGKFVYTSAWGSVAVGFIGLLSNGGLDISNYLGYWPASGVPNGNPMGMIIIKKKIN